MVGLGSLPGKGLAGVDCELFPVVLGATIAAASRLYQHKGSFDRPEPTCLLQKKMIISFEAKAQSVTTLTYIN